jgi:hypothetical protein
MRGEGVPDLDDRALFFLLSQVRPHVKRRGPPCLSPRQNGRTTTMTTMTTSATVGASFISR